MIDTNWEKLKETYTLEDIYNLLDFYKPLYNRLYFKEWKGLKQDIYEELKENNENCMRCNELIELAIDFMEKIKEAKK